MKVRSNQIVWVTGLLIALGLMMPPLPAAAAEGDFDPIVDDVVEMLRAGVDEGVITQWLQSTDRRPSDIGRQGLIALSDAGASEQLISTLLERIEGGETDTAPTQTSPRAKPVPEETQTAGVPATREPAGNGDSVEVIFNLSARRAIVEEDEPDSPRELPWWIYLYLDGELVAWTKPSMRGEPVEARRVVETGQREMRVVLQRYEDLRGGWLHESLSVPTLVTLEARPGSPIEIDVEMKRIWGLWRDRKDGGPLSYLIRQGAEVLAEHQGTGGNPDRWSPVCEDVEANFRDKDGVPKRFRNAMSRCTRWSELWTGSGSLTSREEILDHLAEYNFEPPVR